MKFYIFALALLAK